MTDGISEDAMDVVGVLTDRIEAHFGMSIDHLKAAVAAAPAANRAATAVVKWHGLLVESQTALDRAEDDLLAALKTQPSQVDDPTMALAERVGVAVTMRDRRAQIMRWLLDPDAMGSTDNAAQRTLTGPAVPTSTPHRGAGVPGSVPVPVSRKAVR
ncbi:hypothetical protein ACWEL8_09530 [Streptomyces sp. NPDC004690]